MERTTAVSTPSEPTVTPASPVAGTFELEFPWSTFDPFIVAVHHLDFYPASNAEMGPSTLEGVRAPDENPSMPGWGWYYGDVVPGFPRHPHRGFETVTFVRRGLVDHSDSLGATARYGAGDGQWLTAGRGIQHAEMFPLVHETAPNTLELFQIWLNLPAADKMADASFKMLWDEDVPRVQLKDADGRRTEVTVVAGRFEDAQPPAAPIHSWAARAEAEVAIWQFVGEPESKWMLPPTKAMDTVRVMYVYEGSVEIAGSVFKAPLGVQFNSSEAVAVSSGPNGASTLVLQGRPIGEPVAMGGPFVMNTQVEIAEAYRDYRQ